MFRTLRIQLIGITMAITAAVLLLSFCMLYASTSASLQRPPQSIRNNPAALRIQRLDGDTRALFETQRQAAATQSLAELRIILIVTASIILLVVYVICRYVTDRAIRTIEHAYEMQRQFVADASHELKTPIATISVNTEAALEDAQLPSQWLNNIKHETTRMTQLVSNLLLLAGIDDGSRPPTRRRVTVATVLDQLIQYENRTITHKKLIVQTSYPRRSTITTDATLLTQLLHVLIDNAVKHTEPRGVIKLTIIPTKSSSLIIRIANSHTRIPRQQLEKLFDRFYQIDTSHNTQGHGLGLAIAKALAEKLGASLSVSSGDDIISFDVELDAHKPTDQPHKRA